MDKIEQMLNIFEFESVINIIRTRKHDG